MLLNGNMQIKEIREAYGLSRAEFCRQTGIPIRTVEDWESGKRKPTDWAVKLIEYYLEKEKSVDRR